MAHFSKMLDDLGRTFGRCSDLGKSAIPTASRSIGRQEDDDGQGMAETLADWAESEVLEAEEKAQLAKLGAKAA
jgi:hypothetical protein